MIPPAANDDRYSTRRRAAGSGTGLSHRPDAGFTYVEVLVSVTILLVVMAPMLHVVASGQRLAGSQSEAADLHQRVRVAAERLQKDLAKAGAGALRGAKSDSLSNYFAPVVPARTGSRTPDAPLTAYTDRVTLVYAADGAWPAGLSVDMAAPGDPIPVNAAARGCSAVGLCGFLVGTRAVIVDTSGVGAGHDFFTATGISGQLAHDSPNVAFHRSYQAASAVVVPVEQRTYYHDRAGRRLMVYDGYQSDMPLVDNVVDVRFAYFIDGSSQSLPRPIDSTGNCVFAPGSPPTSRLTDYGRSPGLHPLATTAMTDGPVCGAGPNAFDADLLRIRLIRVTLRLDAASDAVRGATAAFSRTGNSVSGYSYVPDREVVFDVTPRNMTPVVFREH